MTLSDSVQMPIGCRNWQSCTFPSTVPSFLSQQVKTSTSPLFLIVHRDARFWLPEGINLWAKTCQHAWLIIQLNFFQRNFPRNVTGKCIPHADTCCSSFAMNTHTSWFLACLPLSARYHPFPLEKRQSLGCPSSQHISVHRRRTAYFQRMAVFQTSEMDFINLYVIQDKSGFEGWRVDL